MFWCVHNLYCRVVCGTAVTWEEGSCWLDHLIDILAGEEAIQLTTQIMSGVTAVFGAGGPTGSQCISRLVELGLPARAVVRDTEKYKGYFDSSVELVKGDVTDPHSIKSALVGANSAIFAASGNGRYWSTSYEVDNKVMTLGDN